MKLDKRLLAAASLVRPGKSVCDVGTDHGYLPVYLMEKGITERCTACDINEAPLASARQTLNEHGLSDRVNLVLTDGLSGIAAADAEDVIICGMGGELIARILADCSYSHDPDRRFILQPMTRASHLRGFLCEHGFSILRELPVLDGSHRYTILYVAYTGDRFVPSPLFLSVGKIPDEVSPDAVGYLEGEYQRIRRIADGQKTRPEAEASEKLADELYRTLQEVIEKCRSQP